MNEQQNQENIFCIDRETNDKFREYDYERTEPKKTGKMLKSNLKKGKRMSQRKIV
jgi:hypothetical protein